MKNLISKPSFEFMFSAGVIAMLAVPQWVWAQKANETRKDVRIIIRDKDTTYNGKQLKDLPAAERQQALAEINQMGRNTPAMRHRVYAFRRPGSDRLDSVFVADSVRTTARIRINPREDILMDREVEVDRPRLRFRFNDDAFGENRMPGLRLRGFNRRNSQNFNFTYTNKEGITTNLSYHITDAPAEAAKKVAGTSTTGLELTDLTLAPQFTAGKTLLSFTLPAKAAADVQLTDSEGKTLWKDKALNGSFSKAFTLALNGAYYLTVKQGTQTAVKRIVKED